MNWVILYIVVGILSIWIYNKIYKGFSEEENYVWIPIKTAKQVLVGIVFFSLFVPWVIMYEVMKPIIHKL